MKYPPKKIFGILIVSFLLVSVVFSSGCVVQEELEKPLPPNSTYGPGNMTPSEERDNIAEIIGKEVRKRIENVTIGDILDSFSQR